MPIATGHDKGIMGCSGAKGEDEHDVVWFWLEKGKPHECPVCLQYFVLDVIGPGGPADLLKMRIIITDSNWQFTY